MAFVLPAQLLTGVLTIEYVIDYNNDIGSPTYGAAFKWAASMVIFPQLLGIPTDKWTYNYDATDIVEGNWVASTSEGKALRIAEIISATSNTINVVLEDVGSYNAMLDTTLALDGSIQSGDCAIFGLDDFGFPVLGPFPENIFLSSAQANLLARFNHIADFDLSSGGSSELEALPNGDSYDLGAKMGWVPDETLKDEAIADLNVMFRKILPDAYNDFKDITAFFMEDEQNGREFVLASGELPAFDTRYAPAAGDIVSVSPQTATPTLVETSQFYGDKRTLGYAGPGHIGQIEYKLNGTSLATKQLGWTSNVSTTNGLAILSDFEVTEHADIWKALSIQLSGTYGDGSNRIELSHSISGTMVKDFVVDSNTLVPNISSATLQNNSGNVPNLIYMSGIPHYFSNLSELFTLNMTATNLVGRTYPRLDLMGLELNFSKPFSAGYDALEISSTPFVMNAGAISAAGKPFGLPGMGLSSALQPTRNAFAEKIYAYANNTFRSIRIDTNQTIMVYDGDGTYVCETPVIQVPNETIKRQAMPDGQTPVLGNITWDSDYNSGGPGNIGDTSLHEAVVLGGKAQQTKANFSVNHWPAGPDYSGKTDIQYIGFKIQRITNRLRLRILGTFNGVWIKLPGIQNEMPNAVNGWWDGNKRANYPQTLWPGHTLANDGCFVGVVADEYEFSFGSISSANSVDNMIFVRFELIEGQAITDLKVILDEDELYGDV